MHKYSKFLSILNSIDVNNDKGLRDIFNDALNYEYTGSEIPLEFKEQNIQRIIVNSIRHSHSNYEEGLKEVHRLKASEDMYFLYKTVVLEKIALEYPELQDECERQKQNLK